jgi:hypothetical protein
MNEPPPETDPPGQHLWERGWDEHERLQLQRLAKLPLSEKLAWLEEAQRIVERLAIGKEGKAKP